jgi:serine/threonine protein kinase/tetratricopeptide (TPR) repeat protein
MSQSTSRVEESSLDLVEHFCQLCEQEGPVEADAFLAQAGTVTPATTAAILRIDQRARWRRGERILVESYLAKHSGILSDTESTLDLIFNEYLLREQCGDRPDAEEFLRRFPEHSETLRAQIELHHAVGPEMLVGSEHTFAWMDPPQVEPGPLPEVPGYELLDEIARGGMGVIYQARQVSLNRMVALKMISAGAFANPDERARFRTEAEAAARLRHPHIVQIYEVGTVGGVPYLALEYMNGGNLAQALHATPLPARVAAELIELLARTIQAAHEQSILHRDLKPANVLLQIADCRLQIEKQTLPDAESAICDLQSAIPKITDFGLAKDLSGEGKQTTTGAILGTPSYMAPEQAEGGSKHVGPQADVYALGAILYETLTGRPPFQGATMLATLFQVRTQEVVSPSLLQPGLPRDLVTICLKALAKEPRRRYASAAALAEDLVHFLRDEPITARPVTSWERGWRWCRRNPMVASLGTALTLILTGSIIGLTVLYLNAQKQQHLARAGEASARRAEADTKDVLAFFQERVLAANRPKGLWGGLGREATIKTAVDQAEPLVATTFADRPLVEASIRETLGNTYVSLDELPQAIAQHERAVALRRAQQGDEDLDTVGTKCGLALDYQTAGRLAEALALDQENLRFFQAKLGPNHERTLVTMNRLAETLEGMGRDADALPLFEEAWRLSAAARGAEDSTTLALLVSLAQSYSQNGRSSEALPLLENALKIYRGKLGSDHAETIAAMHGLGLVLWRLRRFPEAIAVQQEAVQRRKTTFGPDHRGTLNAMNNLAATYRDAGRTAEAVPILEEVLKIFETKYGADHPKTLAYAFNLALVYQEVDRPADALRLIQETLALRRTKSGNEQPDVLTCMYVNASCLLQLKKYEEAAALARECLALRLQKDPNDWVIFLTKAQLGRSLAGLKQYAEAEALLQEAYQGLTARKDQIPPRPIAQTGQALVELYEAWGKKAQAAEWRQKVASADPSKP